MSLLTPTLRSASSSTHTCSFSQVRRLSSTPSLSVSLRTANKNPTPHSPIGGLADSRGRGEQFSDRNSFGSNTKPLNKGDIVTPWNASLPGRTMTPPHRGRKAVLPPTLAVSRQIDPFYQLSIRVRDEYKNGRLLSSFVSEMGNLKSRGDTGLTLQSHKQMSKAVRRAMHIGTMSRWSTDDKFRGASASKAALGPAGRLEPARIPAAWKHGIAHISSAPRTRLEKLELERNLEEAHAARMKEVWAQASGQKGEGEKAEGQRSSLKMSSEEELKKAREMPVADLPPHMQQ